MKIYSSILIFWGVISILGNKGSCNSDFDTIVWKKGVKLKWDDFCGDNFEGLGIGAASKVKLKLEYPVQKSLRWFSVECLFYKNESTARYNKTDYILNHEQRHFDIGEIYARKIRRDILLLSGSFSTQNYLKLDSIYHSYTVELRLEQDYYDKETDHANDTLKQRTWDVNIDKRLDSLSKFSDHKYKF